MQASMSPCVSFSSSMWHFTLNKLGCNCPQGRCTRYVPIENIDGIICSWCHSSFNILACVLWTYCNTLNAYTRNFLVGSSNYYNFQIWGLPSTFCSKKNQIKVNIQGYYFKSLVVFIKWWSSKLYKLLYVFSPISHLD